MQKICAITGKTFEITDQDLELYKKLGVPKATICPEERHRRKMAFRNERFLYKRACDLCKKEVISMFSPQSPYKIYCNPCWWSDNWNPLEFGRDFDPEKSFLKQFDDFTKEVPAPSLCHLNNENSDYCNFTSHNKNCYMLFGSWFNENVMYGNTAIHSFELNDSLYCNECKHSYELIDCEKCYELFYSQNCTSCSSSYFLFDCKSCESCIFCWNLRNKSYHIFNKPVKKEEFEAAIKSFKGSYQKTKETLDKFKNAIEHKATHRYFEGEQNENCTGGNFLYRSRNCNDVFFGLEVENVTHTIRTSKHQKDSMDSQGTSGGELIYDSMNCDFCYRGQFNLNGDHNSDLIYCWNCYQCENCFGCAGLRHKKYCILNKQYIKEEYETLVERIIKHMNAEFGEFFPMGISPFPYDETVAQEYYPLTKEEASVRGLKWSEENPKNYLTPTITLPDLTTETPETLPKEILSCKSCGKNYRIVQQELDFYKKYSLPVPRKCFGCRHMARLALRVPYKTFNRKCTNCGVDLKSSYASNRPEKVFCEKCYLDAVY
jgi:uncharacterized protein YbaR (Trm112 family)